MKALTISQPFAELIAKGEKWVENRYWGTTYRGPLAIHAGSGTQYMTWKELQIGGHTTGAIIAVAELVACQQLNVLRAMSVLRATRLDSRFGPYSVADVLNHEHTEGPWVWVLANVRRIEPVRCPGQRSLWDWQEQ